MNLLRGFWEFLETKLQKIFQKTHSGQTQEVLTKTSFTRVSRHKEAPRERNQNGGLQKKDGTKNSKDEARLVKKKGGEGRRGRKRVGGAAAGESEALMKYE